MTDLLERAFALASKLPPQQQDAIADWLLKELESEDQWERSFADSQDVLSQLGNEALLENDRGETQDFSLDDE